MINKDFNKFNSLGNDKTIVDFVKPSLNIFAHIAKCKPLGTEEIIYSNTLGYAGRYDYYAYSPQNNRVLIDWKTASQKKPLEYCNNYFLQLTAYSMAIKEMQGDGPQELVVIVFYENSPADVYKLSVQDTQYKAYQEEFIDRLAMFTSYQKQS